MCIGMGPHMHCHVMALGPAHTYTPLLEVTCMPTNLMECTLVIVVGRIVM